MEEHKGKCIICGEEFWKTIDSNYAEVPEGEICQDCMLKTFERYWPEIKDRVLKGQKKV